MLSATFEPGLKQKVARICRASTTHVPRVLSYLSPWSKRSERPLGTGRREPWERGCSFNSHNSISKTNKPQNYIIYPLNDECLVFLFDIWYLDRRSVHFIFEGEGAGSALQKIGSVKTSWYRPSLGVACCKLWPPADSIYISKNRIVNLGHPSPVVNWIRPGSDAELFMSRTLYTELSTWKFRCLNQLGTTFSIWNGSAVLSA